MRKLLASVDMALEAERPSPDSRLFLRAQRGRDRRRPLVYDPVQMMYVQQ